MKLKLFILLFGASIALNAQTEAPNGTPPSTTGMPVATGQKAMRGYKLDNDGSVFANEIKADDLRALVYSLASDSMQGRETGEAGQRKAAQFIAKQFKDAGLPPKGDKGYMQKIMLQSENWKDIDLKVGDQDYRNRSDFYVYSMFCPDIPVMDIKELVFVGYGIEDPKYNDYGKAEVAGKAVIFYNGEPMSGDGKSLITGSEFRSNWSIDWRRKVQLAKQKGAIAAFIIDPNFEESLKKNRKALSSYGWKPVGSDAATMTKDFIPNIFVTPALATALMGDKASKVESEMKDLQGGDKFKAIKIKNKIELKLDKESQYMEGSNVVAVIEGSDEKLKKEFVFVTAHYDHLGMSDSTVIYYGADDNASGTSGVIEIARALAEAKKQGKGPKRTVVCMLVSGEEKGLLGSKYYTEFPLFPLDRTVVDVNIDMIGRIDEKHNGNPDYVYVIGDDRISTDLHQISEMVNSEHTKLELDYKYNAKDDPNHFYERSDHYNFAEKGIPIVFYFNGTHPDYHRPTDTPDKINYDALAKRAQLAFYVAWEVANRPERLSINVKQDKKKEDMKN